MGYRYQIITSPAGVSKIFYEKWKDIIHFSELFVESIPNHEKIYPNTYVWGTLCSKKPLKSWAQFRTHLEIEVPLTDPNGEGFFVIEVGEDGLVNRSVLTEDGFKSDTLSYGIEEW